MKTGICPKNLLKQLSTSEERSQFKEDKTVYDIIMSNKPGQIDELLDHKLKYIRDEVSPKTKEMIIDYVYDRWQMDRSWEGTVKPMKWFDNYFDFFNERHSKYLIDIFEELLSSTPSFDALSYTQSVVRKITPELLLPIEKEFIVFCADRMMSFPRERINYLFDKLREFYEADIIKSSKLKKMAKLILSLESAGKKLRSGEHKKTLDAIDDFLKGVSL